MAKWRDVVVGAATRFASLELLLQLRWEAVLAYRKAVAELDPRQIRRLKGLRQSEHLKVNLGCGPLPIPGWLNLDGAAPEADLIQHLGRPLDLPDACAELVFSEHVLEHLEYPTQAQTLLREAFRILKPGGYLRVIVPDAEKVIRAYVAADAALLNRLAPHNSPIEAVNRIFRENGFHRYAWDYALLEETLRRVGFATVRRASFRDSAVPELNVDHDEPGRIEQSLYAEARKA